MRQGRQPGPQDLPAARPAGVAALHTVFRSRGFALRSFPPHALVVVYRPRDRASCVRSQDHPSTGSRSLSPPSIPPADWPTNCSGRPVSPLLFHPLSIFSEVAAKGVPILLQRNLSGQLLDGVSLSNDQQAIATLESESGLNPGDLVFTPPDPDDGRSKSFPEADLGERLSSQ